MILDVMDITIAMINDGNDCEAVEHSAQWNSDKGILDPGEYMLKVNVVEACNLPAPPVFNVPLSS